MSSYTSNNVSRDEANIFDQINGKQICPDFYYDDFDFHNIILKMHTNIELSLKPNFMSSFL